MYRSDAAAAGGGERVRRVRSDAEAAGRQRGDEGSGAQHARRRQALAQSRLGGGGRGDAAGVCEGESHVARGQREEVGEAAIEQREELRGAAEDVHRADEPWRVLQGQAARCCG